MATTKTTEEKFSGTGSQTVFPFTIEYLATSDLRVFVNNAIQTETTDYSISGSDLTFVTAPASGTLNVKISRSTNLDKARAVYAAGSSVRALDLNANQDQTLFALQERFRSAGTSVSATPPSSPVDGDRWYDSASGRTYVYYEDVDSSQWVEASPAHLGSSAPQITSISNAQVASNAGIEQSKLNLAINTSELADGAVTNAKVDAAAAIDSTKLAFTQTGTGPVARTVDSKLKDIVSSDDFSNSNSTTLQNASAQAKAKGTFLNVLAGTYTDNSNVTHTNVGGFYHLNDSFVSGGINFPQKSAQNLILLESSTDTTTGSVDGNKSRIPLSINARAQGTQHADCIRVNMYNDSTDGQGNTAIYARSITSDVTNGTNATMGIFSETRARVGNARCFSAEAAGFTHPDNSGDSASSGSLIGFLVHNVTGTNARTRHVTNTDKLAGNPDKNFGIYFVGRAYKLVIPQSAITEANPGVFTSSAHGLVNGQLVIYNSQGGTNIVHSAGTLADNTRLYVKVIDANTFNVSLSDTDIDNNLLHITNDGNDNQTFESISGWKDGINFDKGGILDGGTLLNVGTNHKCADGINLSAGTFSGHAIKLNNNQKITFGGSGTIHQTYTGSIFQINNASTTNFQIITTGGITETKQCRPLADNTHALGGGSRRWSQLFAGTATISTSDENEKQDIRDATDAEKKVAVAIKSLFKMFRFKDAVAAKGDNARLHYGVIAQNVETAFKNEGLDPEKYALFCKDTWTDETTNKQVTRLGIRYSELLAFVISTL